MFFVGISVIIGFLLIGKFELKVVISFYGYEIVLMKFVLLIIYLFVYVYVIIFLLFLICNNFLIFFNL